MQVVSRRDVRYLRSCFDVVCKAVADTRPLPDEIHDVSGVASYLRDVVNICDIVVII